MYLPLVALAVVGLMGSGLGLVVASCVVHPDRPVVCIAGDGGYRSGRRVARQREYGASWRVHVGGPIKGSPAYSGGLLVVGSYDGHVYGYAARNAILPNLTGFAMSLGFVVSGAILIEYVFNYPGAGFMLLQAVSSEDYPLMQGLFLLITVAVLFAILVADILTALLDPRTRTAS